MPKLPSQLKKEQQPATDDILPRFVRRLEEQTEFDTAKYKGGAGFDFSSQATLLHLTLQAAVPLWCQELRERERDYGRHRRGYDEFSHYLSERACVCAAVIGETGDALMFKVKGKSAEAFNRLAEGIACASFCPGGIKAFGTHWEFRRLELEVK